MKIFDAKEIFKFAIRIEENGMKFYRYAAVITDDDEMRKTFNFLASEEARHKEIFEGLLSEVTKDTAFETYPDEYFNYLKTYVDNVIFTDKQFEEAMSDIKDTLSTIDFAIKRELDSILYYHEIKRFVPEKQHNLLDEIIEEERKHYTKLIDIKENYA
ncbi:ferritin family protein [candidate division WOR-3 bacterium]|nr:ferritin family protein [candidate division WOR-3 bacterium]